jgi:hypothetical protein
VLAVLVATAACSEPSSAPPSDGPSDDAPGDAPLFADAAFDAEVGVPAVVEIRPAPGTDAWLHDPIRVVFSLPIEVSSATPQAFRLTDGGGAPIAASLDVSGDRTVVVIQADRDVAFAGELHLAVDGVTTEHGDVPPVEAAWTVPAWQRPTGAPDAAPPQRPAIAALPGGEIVVGWATAAGAIEIAALRDGAWTGLGDPLGADAEALALAVDGSQRVIAAWREPGAIRAARWDGATWTALPSPGNGQSPALASADEPYLVYRQSAALRVRRLSGDAWVPVGDDPTDTATDTPTIAAAGATVAIAYLDGSQRLRVRVADASGAWTAAPVIALPDPPAGRGDPDHPITVIGGEAVVAYDWYTPHSWSAHVARFSSGGWQPLAAQLDIDPPGDARGVALGADADGAPIVAWAELADGAQRGYLARWDGAAWQTLAADTWVADPARTASRPALAIARGRAPVVVYQAAAFGAAANAPRAIEAVRSNGPRGPRPGLATPGSTAGCALPSPPPDTLSATGCFTIAGGHATPHAALVPFDINDELWSDGALKRRWIVVPDGETLTPTSEAWQLPVGAMLVKEFAYETKPDNPTTRTPMETRFLIRRGANNWEGLSYRWRASGADADLLPGASTTTAGWPLSGGGVHTHTYPSRDDCLRCHNASAGRVLGLHTGQLARRVDYGGVVSDQLESLANAGVIAAAPGGGAFAVYHDPTETLERRVRGYVQANCADCHNPAGECPQLDLRWETPLGQTRMCDLVVPGSPGGSVLYQKVVSRPGMPPLATLVHDPLIADVMGEWISSITACP